jgi:hypothetical protein
MHVCFIPAVRKTVRQRVIFRRCRVLASAPNWQIKFQIAPDSGAGHDFTQADWNESSPWNPDFGLPTNHQVKDKVRRTHYDP